MILKYLWIVGLILTIFFWWILKPLTGNALPNAIGYDLANLVVTVTGWIGVAMIVISARYNLSTKKDTKTSKDK